MGNFSIGSISETKIVNFDYIPVDAVAEELISIQNTSDVSNIIIVLTDVSTLLQA